MFESKFRVVSIGIAAENKKLESYELPIAPIEMFPLVDGELMESLDETDVSGANQADIEYTVKIRTSSTLTATWLQLGSNRVTAPDVRRGERVKVWQYGDSDKYYWTPMGMDDEQRRLETVIWAWSATPDIEEELEISKNMYSVEVSSHGKHITLHTTRANGEPFEYTMQLNTKDGLFFLTDQDGNSVQLNSAERIIKAINSDKSEITIDKTKIRAYAKDEIKARSDDHMEASAGGNLDIFVEGDVNQYVKGNYNLKVDGDILNIVGGSIKENVSGNVSTLAGGPIDLDGVGVNLQSGAAAGNASLSFAVPGGGGGSPSSGGGSTPTPAPEPSTADLPEEYSVANATPVITSAGRYAALDEQSEISVTPKEYPEDVKPASYTGAPKTISTRTAAQRPTGKIDPATIIADEIDYDQLLGTTDFTIGDLSAYAVFPHLIREQVGLSKQTIVSNLEAVATKLLQPLKNEFGPFTVNSGFRVGSGSSQHIKGQGVDIQGAGWTPQEYMVVAEWIADNLPCDQLIFEHGNSIWLHVSFDTTKPDQRGELLTMLNGNYEPGLKNYYA